MLTCEGNLLCGCLTITESNTKAKMSVLVVFYFVGFIWFGFISLLLDLSQTKQTKY